MKNTNTFKSLSIAILLLVSFFATAQQTVADQKLLLQEPNFLKGRLKATDSLFVKDLTVLKKFIAFDSIDVEILKPQILYAVLSESKVDSIVTYRTLIDAVKQFKEGIGYSEFRKGIILYKQMAAIKVNSENWEKDQMLFRKLGFTEADLEDFLLFISKPENKNLNYKEAYLAYMKEIDSLQ